MSLHPDPASSSFPMSNEAAMQQQQLHFNPVAMGQQPYMIPPSSLPTTPFHPPPLPPSHSSLPSTSSPITPAPLPSPSAGPSTSAGPLKRRRFSGAKIQPTRIKKVMQADEEIGRMVASVPVAIGRAMEHFAEKFLLTAASIVNQSGARTLAPHHLKLAMLNTPHFAFLEPILREVGLPARAGEAYHFPQQATVLHPPAAPPPAAAADAMQLMQAQQQAYLQQLQQQGMAAQGQQQPYMEVPSMIPSGVPPIGGGAEGNPYLMHNPYLMPQLQQPGLPYDPLAAMSQMMAAGGGGGMPIHGSPLSSPITPSPIPSSPTTAAPPIAAAPRAFRRSSSAVSNGEGEATVKKPRGRPRKVKKDKCVEDDLVVDANMADNGILKPASPGDIKTESNEADRLLMPPPPMLPMKMPPS